METIEVVAAVIERGGRILIARRPRRAHLGGLWEFPGGKPRAGESPAQALRREIREELGATVRVGKLLEAVEWAYPERRVRLLFYRCALAGDPRPLEGQRMAWVAPADLRRYRFPPADAQLVDRLSRRAPRPRPAAARRRPAGSRRTGRGRAPGRAGPSPP